MYTYYNLYMYKCVGIVCIRVDVDVDELICPNADAHSNGVRYTRTTYNIPAGARTLAMRVRSNSANHYAMDTVRHTGCSDETELTTSPIHFRVPSCILMVYSS